MASAVGSSTDIYEQFLCPITKTHLTTAVILLPCTCRVNKVVIEKIFSKSATAGSSEGDSKERKECPVCQKVVDSYLEDAVFRSIAIKILSSKEEKMLISAISETDKKENSSKETQKLPFPGKGARFIAKRDNWEIHDTGGSLVRNMVFVSTTSASSFTQLSICGYRNGSIAIFITCQEDSTDAVRKYFLDSEVQLEYAMPHTLLMIKEKDSLKKVYSILVKHNTIPAKHLTLIHGLVEAGHWNGVTPLKFDEPPTIRGGNRKKFFIF